MKISTFLLSLSGLFAFYIYYADWIDELIDILSEDYFGIDYEEVAPFIPSDTQGTEEFDSIVEELSNPRAKNIAKYQIVLALISIVTLAVLGRRLLKRAKTKLRENEGKANSFPLTIIGRRQRIIRKNLEDVPVQVIWKGNNLIESSVHCNLKEETSEGKARKEIIHAKPRGGGDEQVTHTSSNESTTVHRLKQARKLLESEHKCMGTDDMSANEPQQLESDVIVDSRARVNSLRFGDKKSDPIAEENPETGKPKEEFGGDPKLMNRIRLLESRLRLEELKNRSWITRMTRAEGILQQLNKQVERIEQSRPVEATLMKTLKITSTVTNWMPLVQPRKNYQFTLVKQYVPQFQLRQQPFESLSDLIKREVALPYLNPKRIMTLPKSPLVPALPSPMVTPQTSILSKLLSK